MLAGAVASTPVIECAGSVLRSAETNARVHVRTVSLEVEAPAKAHHSRGDYQSRQYPGERGTALNAYQHVKIGQYDQENSAQ